MPELSNKEVDIFAQIKGVDRTEVLLNYLGKNVNFIDAMKTPIGEEIIKSAISGMKLCLEIILVEIFKTGEITETAKANAIQLKVYYTLINDWVDRVKKYYGVIEEIRSASQN